LISAGVNVEQRAVSAADPAHHDLRFAALLAGFACGSG
jgi:hypothetical protein